MEEPKLEYESFFCPNCGSSRINLYGFSPNLKQRHICKDCGRTFILPQSRLYTLSDNEVNQQIGDTAGVSKNLLKTEKQIEATLRDNQQINKIIDNFKVYLKRLGLKELTIESRSRELSNLMKYGANIYDPESVTDVLTIVETGWKPNYKRNLKGAYNHFCKFAILEWKNPPRFRQEDTTDNWIPKKETVYQLIDALPKKKSILVQLLAETGMRGYEAERLLWSDIDFDRYTIDIKTVKYGKARLLSVSNMYGILTKGLFGRLKLLPKKNERVFGCYKYYAVRNNYRGIRKRIAHKLNNPNILRVNFHKLRHYVGTWMYIKTKCPITVMHRLGHRNLNSVNTYIHLAEAYITEPTNFIVKIANTNDELTELIEQGFEYHCNSVEGKPVLRKPK